MVCVVRPDSPSLFSYDAFFFSRFWALGGGVGGVGGVWGGGGLGGVVVGVWGFYFPSRLFLSLPLTLDVLALCV